MFSSLLIQIGSLLSENRKSSKGKVNVYKGIWDNIIKSTIIHLLTAAKNKIWSWLLKSALIKIHSEPRCKNKWNKKIIFDYSSDIEYINLP